MKIFSQTAALTLSSSIVAVLAIGTAAASTCNDIECQDCLSNKVETGIRGCQCDLCETKVCAQDSYCCDTEWDGLCQGLANNLCTKCIVTTNPPTPQPTEQPTEQPSQQPTLQPIVDNIASGANAWANAGSRNRASGDNSAVSGGSDNTASGDHSIVAGGTDNTASNSFGSAVLGGFRNTASGGHSVVVGGGDNTADGLASAIVGGRHNVASGWASFVGGGYNSQASAHFSAAFGRGAYAAHYASAVLNFASTDCNSTEPHSVQICAENGLIVNGKNVPEILDALADTQDSFGTDLHDLYQNHEQFHTELDTSFDLILDLYQTTNDTRVALDTLANETFLNLQEQVNDTEVVLDTLTNEILDLKAEKDAFVDALAHYHSVIQALEARIVALESGGN